LLLVAATKGRVRSPLVPNDAHVRSFLADPEKFSFRADRVEPMEGLGSQNEACRPGGQTGGFGHAIEEATVWLVSQAMFRHRHHVFVGLHYVYGLPPPG